METVEERLERLEFYNQLTIESVDLTSYPFFRLVMEKKLTEQEVNDIIQLCDELEKIFFMQKESGFVHYTHVLIHFAGMLTPKLNPRETILALLHQEKYISLMETLYELSVRYE
jgi:1-deoxy-D-xylulose 5-phosphate reductoisomerase